MAAPDASPRRPWRTVFGYAALVGLFVVNAAWAESRQRVRDAAALRDSSEVKALLYWAALKCGSR